MAAATTEEPAATEAYARVRVSAQKMFQRYPYNWRERERERDRKRERESNKCACVYVQGHRVLCSSLWCNKLLTSLVPVV